MGWLYYKVTNAMKNPAGKSDEASASKKSKKVIVKKKKKVEPMSDEMIAKHAEDYGWEVEWLEGNSQPFADVETKWEETTPLRVQAAFGFMESIGRFTASAIISQSTPAVVASLVRFHSYIYYFIIKHVYLTGTI